MLFDVLTLFPEMFSGPLDTSMMKRARDRGLIQVNICNIRDFSRNKHHTVDDTPYGGGGGMVMNAEPIHRAVRYVQSQEGRNGPVILMSPQGRRFSQDVARELASHQHVILICGHYEGIDERVRTLVADDEISIGDFVLTGGELPAMIIVDAVARFVPGVLGEAGGAEDDSFASGLLEYPQYTKPRCYEGLDVPQVLVSGHHGMVERWRREESLLRTLVRKPELIENTPNLTKSDWAFLKTVSEKLGILLRKEKPCNPSETCGKIPDGCD